MPETSTARAAHAPARGGVASGSGGGRRGRGGGRGNRGGKGGPRGHYGDNHRASKNKRKGRGKGKGKGKDREHVHDLPTLPGEEPRVSWAFDGSSLSVAPRDPSVNPGEQFVSNTGTARLGVRAGMTDQQNIHSEVDRIFRESGAAQIEWVVQPVDDDHFEGYDDEGQPPSPRAAAGSYSPMSPTSSVQAMPPTEAGDRERDPGQAQAADEAMTDAFIEGVTSQRRDGDDDINYEDQL